METRKNENVKEKGKEPDLEQFDVSPDQLSGIAGGANPFADMPRVPLQPIDPGLRENA